MVSFRMGVAMGANGIETDVQRTKDGVLVLYHDDVLKRTLGLEGSICDYTFREVESFDAGAFKGEQYRGERIPTLEAFLKEFGNRGLKLAIEIKQRGVEYETLDMVRAYLTDGQYTMTSFKFDVIENLAKVEHRPELGFLSREYSEELLDKLVSLGVVEYCPNASDLTPAVMQMAAQKGLRVRAWGVKTPRLMDKMVDFGVYGMTVNFPDLLVKRLQHEQC